MSNQTLGCLIIVGVILFVMIISQFGEDEKPKPYEPDETEAWIMAKQLMLKGLKAPSTAEFAPRHESTIRFNGADSWTVKSYVDSQNGFGAMIRTQFIITMSVDLSTKYWTTTKLVTDP